MVSLTDGNPQIPQIPPILFLFKSRSEKGGVGHLG
jgi:hypothetical protein